HCREWHKAPPCASERSSDFFRTPRVILPCMRLFPLLLCLSLSAFAQDEPPAAGEGGGRGGRGGPGSNEPINENTFSSLKARQIGPAFVSGRISQIAVFP